MQYELYKGLRKTHIWYVYDLILNLAKQGQERFFVETIKEPMDDFFEADIPPEEIINIISYYMKTVSIAKIKILYVKNETELIFDTVTDLPSWFKTKELKECRPVFYINSELIECYKNK